LEKRWYVIHTYSGQEKKVQKKLEATIAQQGLEDQFGRVVIATEQFVEMKSGKRTTSERRIFPGYVLIEMEMNDETQYLVTNTPGVARIIGTSSGPQPLEQAEVDRVLGRIERKPLKERPVVPFHINDQVRVVDGPFNDFVGTVHDIDSERGKVKIMVSIFGRATPVELDFLQVESL
jgi:transcriptional antiterminator NusG